jgi:hypothetical protein
MRRRLFLGGLAASIAAPALVARANIMPVRSIAGDFQPFPFRGGTEFDRLLEALEHWQREIARLTACPPLISGELGQIERFNIITSSVLPPRFVGVRTWR